MLSELSNTTGRRENIAPLDTKPISISQIVERDRQGFEDWLATVPKEDRRTIQLPHAALRYLLIPQRVLELADDPTKVDVRHVPGVGEDKYIVFERKNTPVTDKESLQSFLQTPEYRKYLTTADLPEPPPDVDRYHAIFSSLLENNILQLNDYVYFNFTGEVKWEDTLHVTDYGYGGKEELKHKKIATSFYNRLHEATTQMGFRFIYGNNNQQNVTFFIGLGRFSLSQLKPHVAQEFWNKMKTDNDELDIAEGWHTLADAMSWITIDFLCPEDITTFVLPEVLEQHEDNK